MLLNPLRKFVFLSVAVLCFAGCKLPFEPLTTSIQQLYPLQYGNYWIYEIQNFDDSGTVVSDLSATTEVVDSIKAGIFVEYEVDFGDGNSAIFYFDNTDLFYMNFDSESSLPLLRYPMHSEETIPFTIGVIDTLGRFQKNLTYHGENEPVTVGAGKFNCYHYEVVTNLDTSNGFQPFRTQDNYYASGVGLVQEINYSVAGGVKKKLMTKSLSSFRVQ